MEIGLSCNHNLVLWNCARFREIREFLKKQSDSYFSVEAHPPYLLYLSYFLDTNLENIMDLCN